jgi:hypothetical protein
MFGSASKKPNPEPNVAAARPPGEDSAAVRKREEAAYFRRLNVCDKLKEIGYQTGDAPLQELADQLAQRAFDVYVARVANLPPSRGEGDLDEQLLHKLDEKQPATGARLSKSGRTLPTQQDARAGGLFGGGR